MSGYRSLAKNIGILTIANFGTKILSFLLVPLYTSILSTAEYGTYDLVNNTIGILIPIFTQNIVDGVLRFSIDEDSNKSDVIGIGLRYFALSLLPLTALLVANSFLGISPELADLSALVLLLYVAQGLSNILLYYARGLNRFTDVAVSSVLASAMIIGCNILFLAVLRLGLVGYFLANVIGPLLQIAFLFIRLKLYHVKLHRKNNRLNSEMLAFSRPLIANNIAWWVNNVSDRYVVTYFCGIAANGIYSIAFKIPSILSVFQSIISQAWTVSAVEEFDPEDKNGFFSNTYTLYNCAMVLLCTLVIASDRVLATFLYANDFFNAWQYVPFLTIAMVFGAMAGFVGGVFSAVKDAKEYAKSSVIGAVVNVILNLLTVPFFGAFGSAVATTVCYWLTWYLRMIKVRSYINLRISFGRDCASYVVLLLQGTLLLVTQSNLPLLYAFQAACVLVIFFLYRAEGRKVFYKVLTTLRKS